MPIGREPPRPALRKLDPKNLQAEKNKVFPRVQGDPSNVIGWIRAGGCTTGCGACCEAVLLPIATQYMGQDWAYWLELHGITVFESGGVTWAYLPTPCQQLQEDKGCGLHGTPEKPEICKSYPTHPVALWNLDVCTYKFAPILVPNRAQRRKAAKKTTQKGS